MPPEDEPTPIEYGYFVYHDIGSCQMGDHSVGLEGFDTFEEAALRVKELKDGQFHESSDTIVVLHGTEVEWI